MCTAAPPLMQVNEVVESGVLKLSPGIKELVGNLHSNGVAVFLISGGFIQMVTPIANMLNIPVDNIYANELRFNEDGSFKDFNPRAYTSCNGGKTRAIAHIREAYGSSPPPHLLHLMPHPLPRQSRRIFASRLLTLYGARCTMPPTACNEVMSWATREPLQRAICSEGVGRRC